MPPQTASQKLSSRTPAVVVGALVPLGLGVAAIVAALTIAAQSSAPFRQAGPAATAMLIIPGTMLLGSVFAFPTAVALVSSMTWLMRRSRHADRLLTWALAGLLFALLFALILWTFDAPRTFPFGFIAGESLGLIGGIAAGLKRPQFIQP